MTASEMLCFSRYLGLIIGDLVPSSSQSWSLYLLLKQILDITLSKSVRPGMQFCLQQMPELPENFYILGGFLAITRLATRMGVLNRIVQLVDYVRQYWLTTVRPSGFSVYGVNIRTNNFVESFHSMLKSTIGTHPPVWSFYGN